LSLFEFVAFRCFIPSPFSIYFLFLFSISSENVGWDSLNSGCETQHIAQIYQEHLFAGGDDALRDLLNNVPPDGWDDDVQPDWDDDDAEEADSRRMKLTGDSAHPGSRASTLFLLR
jgi:hypothetical protein